MRCLDCKNEADGEIGDDWRCLDREACAIEQQRRLDANPYVRLVREVERRVSETQTEEKAAKAEKAEKAPKPATKCVHCDQPTRGGKFLPGHDARFVSEQVSLVLNDESTTEEGVLAKMKELGTTETLQSKFTKSLRLAREAEAKKAEAKQVADEKAKEKIAAEAKQAEEKKAAVEAEPTPDADQPVDGVVKPAPAKKAAAKKS